MINNINGNDDNEEYSGRLKLLAFMTILRFKLNLQWSLTYTLLLMICYQFVFAYPIHKLVFEFNKYVAKWK